MSAAETFLDGRVMLHCGDCLDVLAAMPTNSVDAVVTDPPYHLASIVKRFGPNGSTAPVEGVFRRSTAGFMGKQWDGGDIAFDPATWAAVLRVLKPGGHMLAFAAPRNQHRMICAIEDAGFEIRDCLMWIFGSGFPKSHDVSKGIDRMFGAERDDLGPSTTHHGGGTNHVYAQDAWTKENFAKKARITAPATPEAQQWEGWGTALKPAYEPICLARKPLDGTIAGNVLKHGTGGLNIDGCRILGEVPVKPQPKFNSPTGKIYNMKAGEGRNGEMSSAPLGRWPANVLHDGSPEVVGMFDSGSAARFFYSAKADTDDRIASKHPTVKPLDLKQYLVRLVCPRGGLVLDPFAGTGTTGEAAWREGCRSILVERETEYQADIRRRMAWVLMGPDGRAYAKAKHNGEPADALPLFRGFA